MLKQKNNKIFEVKNVHLDEQDIENQPGPSFRTSFPRERKKRGRKLKPFELKSKRSQLALAQEIRKKYPQGAITQAFEQGLKIDARGLLYFCGPCCLKIKFSHCFQYKNY